MNDTQSKLLKKNVIVLPNGISPDAYEYVLEALMDTPDQKVQLYCRGNGGESRDAFAIADLIQQHGQVIGILAGAACSSHIICWAACSERYVYPYGALELHMVSSYISVPIDFTYAKLLAEGQDLADRRTAELLAKISEISCEYWLTMIHSASSSGSTAILADELIAKGMARPIGELKVV
jgi:hypothetical protein